MMEFLSKGKRGIVYRAGKKVVKKANPDSRAFNNIGIEAQFLKLLNKHGIGPRFYKYENDGITMEYIEGTRIGDFIQQARAYEILSVLTDVLRQCSIMDNLKINKKELTNPYKHIIIREDKPIMIDFERCRYTEKPQNVNQFIQYLTSRKISGLLENKGFSMDRKKLRSVSAAYSKDFNVFPVLECLKDSLPSATSN